MSKEMLDILVDQKKVEEIAALPTNEDVEGKLKKEGIDVTSKDVKVLGNVFKTVAEQGPEAVDEKLLASVGGGVDKFTKERLKKAGKAIAIIGGAVFTGGAIYQGVKHKDTIKGWFTCSDKDKVIKDGPTEIENEPEIKNDQP